MGCHVHTARGRLWVQSQGLALVLSTLSARLAQLVERKALNLVVVGSSPTVGGYGRPLPIHTSAHEGLSGNTTRVCVGAIFVYAVFD